MRREAAGGRTVTLYDCGMNMFSGVAAGLVCHTLANVGKVLKLYGNVKISHK